MSDSGLKVRTIKNLSFNTVAKGLMFALQAVSNIILTRTLVPDDYGLVGMALIFMNFFTLFGDMGISQAVIRKEELSQRELQTGFTVRVIQGVLLALIGLAVSPFAGTLFNNPEVGWVLAVFSCVFLINGLGFIPHAHLNRELRYDRLFIPQVGYAVGGSAVAITLALMGFRHWSLVFSTLASALTYVVLLHVMRPSRVGFSFDWQVAKHFFSYGMNIFLIGFVTYALSNAGNFVIGAVQGSKALGYYTIAFTWGGMICAIIIGTVSSVLFPTFAKMQGDRDRLRHAFLKIFEFVGAVAILANLSLFLTGRDFLYVVLGHGSDKWFPSLIALQILCGFGIVKSLVEPGANLLMAVGNTSIPFRATLVAAIIQVALIYPALHYGGIEGVASLIFIATTIQFSVFLPALKRYLDLSLRDIAAQVFPALLAMLITWAMVGFCAPFLGELTFSSFCAKAFLTLFLFVISYGTFTRWRIYGEIKGFMHGRSGLSSARSAKI